MLRVAAFFLAGWTGLGLFPADAVRFAIGEWAPYTEQGQARHGMAAEIVTAACLAAELQPEYEFFPWKRAEARVLDGSFFATFPYQETPERTRTFLFSEVICRSSNALLLHRGSSRMTPLSDAKIEDLKGLRIGTLAGSDAVALPLRQAGALVEEVQSVGQNLQKLEADRIDGIIDDRPVLYAALAAHCAGDPQRMDRFYFAERPFGHATEYRLMVSTRFPDSRRLLARFNTGLRKIRASGDYQKILRKFGL